MHSKSRACILASGGRPNWAASATIPSLLQEAEEQWTFRLARQCHDAALGLLVVGVYQPPLRVGALRVVHSCKALDKPCIYECCLDKQGCVPNQLHYYKDRRGYHGELVLSHFKNESLKGNQRLPLSTSLLEVFALLEQAAFRLKANTLFSLMDGRPYPGPYFSSKLCIQAVHWCAFRLCSACCDVLIGLAGH